MKQIYTGTFGRIMPEEKIKLSDQMEMITTNELNISGGPYGI